MKRSLFCTMMGLALVSGFTSCSDDPKYDTSVIKQVELYSNGKPWSLSLALNTRPIFIYNNDGTYVNQVSSNDRFSLENGRYKIVATQNPDDCIGLTANNLNDLYIAQDSAADRKFMEKIIISKAVDYTVPSNEPLVADMLTRTGTLRLQALDDEKDMSYSTVRAIMTTPRSAYRIADESYVEQPMEVSRDKATPTGGRNYTDDFVLFPTESDDKGVSIRFEFLDAAKNVVKTKTIEGTYGVYRDSIQVLQVYLNDPDDNTAHIPVPVPEEE